jgi:ribosome-associated protein
VSFVRDSGPGGQHRNKRETAVRVVHPPSGIVIVATERRSQARNLDAAFERLAARLRQLNRRRKRRVPTKVPTGARRAREEAKRQRSQTKTLRQRPRSDD